MDGGRLPDPHADRDGGLHAGDVYCTHRRISIVTSNIQKGGCGKMLSILPQPPAGWNVSALISSFQAPSAHRAEFQSHSAHIAF